MNLLYLTFGDNISNHIQAHFSIYSFLTQENSVSSINVLTDQPDYYKSIGNYINVTPLDDATLKQWKGDYDFFWRIKIKAIEKLCDQYKNEAVMYLDTDTFLYRNIDDLKKVLQQGTAVMHENEGTLSSKKSKTEKRMWEQVKNKNYDAVEINTSHAMWNAGVVATPNTVDNKEFSLALQICDEMCRQGVTKRLIEQFALSVSLHETYGLQPAKDSIAHYWSNKEEWERAILRFLVTSKFKLHDHPQIIEDIKAFDFKTIPVTQKVRNTNTRLQKLVNKSFPARDIQHVKNLLRS